MVNITRGINRIPQEHKSG